MSKQILAIPKYAFDNRFTNDDFIKYKDKACFISVVDESHVEKKYDTSIENFLQVKMWDVESDVSDEYKKPSDAELLKVVNFVNKHINKHSFIVHCGAGISRSGAIVVYIKDKIRDHIDIAEFHRLNTQIQPNLYILNRLKQLDDTIQL